MTTQFLNLKNRVISDQGKGKGKGPMDGLEIRGCYGCTIRAWTVVGGLNNIYMQDCQRCVVEECRLSAPRGGEDKGFGHGIQFDNCDFCIARRNKIVANPNSEDRINIYKSRDCRALNNLIVGHGRSKSGNGITVDFNSYRAIIRGNIIDPKGGWGGIVIADGQDHIIEDNEVSNVGCAYTIRCIYDNDGHTIPDNDATPRTRKTKNVHLARNKATRFEIDYWIDPLSTEAVTMTP